VREKLEAAAMADHEEEKPREDKEDRGSTSDISDVGVVTGGNSTELDFIPLEIKGGQVYMIYCA